MTQKLDKKTKDTIIIILDQLENFPRKTFEDYEQQLGIKKYVESLKDTLG